MRSAIIGGIVALAMSVSPAMAQTSPGASDPNNASLGIPTAVTYGTSFAASRVIAWTCNGTGTLTTTLTFANGGTWAVTLPAATSELDRGWIITNVGTPTYSGPTSCTFEALN